ncbi:glycosyltransferase family 2 protein [Flavobacteriaceae bacterium LMO-SS05]
MNPKVSIIVPNYNHAVFLQQRLESVFNQSYQDFEVILLDDTSTDDSLAFLEAYRNHPKVSHFIINAENSGSPFKQWQKGLALAKGDYIWIAESDDYCELNFLEILMGKLSKDTVLVYCASNLIKADGALIGRQKWADALDTQRWQHSFSNDGIHEVQHYLRFRNTIPNASAVIFKKEAVKIEKIATDFKFCGDWNLWIAILKQGNIVYHAQCLNYFRNHSSNTRHIKRIALEKLRYKEYHQIVCENSSFLERIVNRRQYLWILKEWKQKHVHLDKFTIFKVKMPIILKLHYLIKKIV